MSRKRMRDSRVPLIESPDGDRVAGVLATPQTSDDGDRSPHRHRGANDTSEPEIDELPQAEGVPEQEQFVYHDPNSEHHAPQRGFTHQQPNAIPVFEMIEFDPHARMRFEYFRHWHILREIPMLYDLFLLCIYCAENWWDFQTYDGPPAGPSDCPEAGPAGSPYPYPDEE
eukprot:TRINITY_DN929_c0_g1_i1.p1 TRINITY_DN929_c0_g1~~TRINITY_DN929_c0_g1_i1.p1  ORF type:complete len:170 (+),score=9.08 TRINITY_DN929_c0_g1_i1:221-730(+)